MKRRAISSAALHFGVQSRGFPRLSGPSQASLSTTALATVRDQDSKKIHKIVQKYYGETLSESSDLKTDACSATAPLAFRGAINKVPDEITAKYYGCGSPFPFGIEGLTILDLGSGSGRDCYVASQMVGEQGQVIGIDMTDELLTIARKHNDSFCLNTLEYGATNMEFIKGYMELLPEYLDPGSIDVIISNCALNQSPRKDQVLSGVYNLLKEGGEFHFSDMYCDRRLSKDIRSDPAPIAESLGGALCTADFHEICHSAGFVDPRVLSVKGVNVQDPELKETIGDANYFSITHRLFKHKKMEDQAECDGHVAVYKGTIAEHPDFYDLDDQHRFFTNAPMLVCGNTVNMVGESWLGSHFEVTREDIC